MIQTKKITTEAKVDSNEKYPKTYSTKFEWYFILVTTSFIYICIYVNTHKNQEVL